MNTYKLITDGDLIEIKYWSLFIQEHFPYYELFWIDFVIPLTNRPKNIHFKTDEELAKIGKTINDICIAQLHYTILVHLARTYDFISLAESNSRLIIDKNVLSEGIMHIVGAQDVAFELLSRFTNPNIFDPWSDDDSKKAKQKWQKDNSYPLQGIRHYRNYLIHGRTLPSFIDHDHYLPKIGAENKYFDWRPITDPSNHAKINFSDFASTKDILWGAWLDTLSYLNNSWQKELLQKPQ